MSYSLHRLEKGIECIPSISMPEALLDLSVTQDYFLASILWFHDNNEFDFSKPISWILEYYFQYHTPKYPPEITEKLRRIAKEKDKKFKFLL